MMANTRLLRFLLSIFVRFRTLAGSITHTCRARLALLWRSFLGLFGRRQGQDRIRGYADDVPPAVRVIDNRPNGVHPKDEGSETLAARPFQPHVDWLAKVATYQARTSSHKNEFVQKPVTPAGGSQRYEPKRVNPNVKPLEINEPKELLSTRSEPPGWKRYVHPEGNVLYYHEDLRIFTESDIFRRGNDIIYCATILIEKAIFKGNDVLDKLTEIVLNVDSEENWCYYFVNHKDRLLFWVDPVQPRDNLRTHLQGITTYSHIRYYVEAQYWYASFKYHSGMSYIGNYTKSRWHCAYYPHGRILPKEVYEALRSMLNFAKIDIITSDSSSCPFTRDDLNAILDLVNSLKDDKHISDRYTVWVIARLTALFTENQFLGFTGEPCARLDADTPLFGQQTWNRSIVFKCVNLFLFGSPNDHAIRLKRVWVDGIIIEPRWKDFVTRLTSELGRYTIFSTVLLAVNISFLAVPGVIPQNEPASTIQIIIYCSVVSTVASIVFSFVLLNMYSDPGLMIAGSAASVMQKLSDSNSGMASLAITHSLPVACLIWSIALFSTALAVQVFEPGERATVTTLGVECLVLVIFAILGGRVIWQFYKNVDKEEPDEGDDSEKEGSAGGESDIEKAQS